MIDGVSIIICCYNSEKRIGKVLEHLMVQEYDPTVAWEVLIVDNASTDQTVKIARAYWNHPEIKLRTVDEPNPGLSNARQKGLAESAFEIVSFIDDDNWVEKTWVNKVYAHMNSNPRTGILGGRGSAYFEEDPPSWFSDVQGIYAVGPQAKESGRHYTILYGAGLNLRKQAWEHLKLKGFDFLLSDRKGSSLSSGGDSELCLAVLLAGFELYYDQDLTFVHQMPRGRVQWDYLIRLIKAIGRAGPVSNIYFSFLRETGIDKLKYEHPAVAWLNGMYNCLRTIPALARKGFYSGEGSLEYFRYLYHRYSLKETTRLFFAYPSLVGKIRDAEWRENKAEHV